MSAAAGVEWIEVYVADLRQIFHSMDPSPFHERDLDPDAEEFIVSWARDMHGGAPLGLRVHLDREPTPGDAEVLRQAVDEHFTRMALSARSRLRRLFRRGRISLVIGLVFVAGTTIASEMAATALASAALGGVIANSLAIGGWVAMWRPLEIFLYDWWPIRADARLYGRLRAMPVTVVRRSAA